MPGVQRTGSFAALLLVAMLALSGCAPAQEEVPVSEVPSVNDPVPLPQSEVPTIHPDGSASDNLPFFTETMREFSEGKKPVNGEQVVNAVAAAGFDKSVMQVTFDHSQTGLVADNIFVSVRFDGECLIAQVVSSNREFVTVIEPAVGPNKNICIIGETRVINW